MAEAEATGGWSEPVSELASMDLLVLEDLGLKTIPAGGAEYLLEVFFRRYEKASTIVTTNRPIEDWSKVLSDTVAAGALLGRFLHHADVITITEPSYRLHERKRRGLDVEGDKKGKKE
jgi:DNA replication protein DnaC